MGARYPDEIKSFIEDNVNGTYSRELVEKINSTFGTAYTYSQIRSYKKNHNLKSNVISNRKPGSILFTKEIEQFIADNVVGISVKELVIKVNQTFNTEYTYNQIRTYKNRHNLKNGIDSRFRKGRTPENKGKKGVYGKGCEKTWFKKGGIPGNHRPIGSERICSKDGYIIVKTAEPNVWQHKHRVVWEQHNGAIQKDKVVIFLDGNKTNLDISNLQLISRNELRLLNVHGLKSDNAALTETGVLIAKLLIATHKKKKENKK